MKVIAKRLNENRNDSAVGRTPDRKFILVGSVSSLTICVHFSFCFPLKFFSAVISSWKVGFSDLICHWGLFTAACLVHLIACLPSLSLIRLFQNVSRIFIDVADLWPYLLCLAMLNPLSKSVDDTGIMRSIFTSLHIFTWER